MGKFYHEVENGNGLPSSIATVGGTVSVNTTRMQGDLILVYVKATTATNKFDFKLTDSKSRVFPYYKEEVGTLRDNPRIPLVGKYTLIIENADVDEAFDILLRLGDKE